MSICDATKKIVDFDTANALLSSKNLLESRSRGRFRKNPLKSNAASKVLENSNTVAFCAFSFAFACG